jgi:hypothetical protein
MTLHSDAAESPKKTKRSNCMCWSLAAVTEAALLHEMAAPKRGDADLMAARDFPRWKLRS